MKFKISSNLFIPFITTFVYICLNHFTSIQTRTRKMWKSRKWKEIKSKWKLTMTKEKNAMRRQTRSLVVTDLMSSRSTRSWFLTYWNAEKACKIDCESGRDMCDKLWGVIYVKFLSERMRIVKSTRNFRFQWQKNQKRRRNTNLQDICYK